MKIKIFIDKEHDEEVVIYAREKSELVEKIERLVKGNGNIVAKRERVAYNINLCDVVCFHCSFLLVSWLCGFEK